MGCINFEGNLSSLKGAVQGNPVNGPHSFQDLFLSDARSVPLTPDDHPTSSKLLSNNLIHGSYRISSLWVERLNRKL